MSYPRIGFLGCGWIGCARLKALQNAGVCSIEALADPDSDSISRAANLAPEAKVFASLESMFECDLDGIVISTPNAQHAEQSRKVLSRGLAVFCQKPLGRNRPETEEIVAAARRANRLIASDLSYRFTSGMQRIRELVESGIPGKLYALELCFHNSYGPDKAWYYSRSSSGGGCLIDLGIHLVDLALWILRFPKLRVSSARLYSGGLPLTREAGFAIEDYASATLDVEDGAHIQIACSWKQPTGGDALISGTFRGSNGTAEFSNLKGSFYDFSARYHSADQHELIAEPPDDWGGRAITRWALQLAQNNGFDDSAFELVRVADMLDRIYVASRAEKHWR
jgi:predicted dehydrogenase